LWCATCSQLVCPYCLSVGQHRGHDGRELDEIVSKVRTSLAEAVATVTERRETAQRTLSVLQLSKRDLEDKKLQGEQNINSAFAELESLLSTKKLELIDELHSKGSQVDNHASVLIQYMEQCDARRKEFDGFSVPQDASREGKMSFLRNVQMPLTEWHSKPLPQPPFLNVPAASAVVSTYINTRPCQGPIRQLHLQNQPLRHNLNEPHGDESDVGTSRDAVASLQQQLATQRVQLSDATKGYIWCIPQAERVLHVDQRKDIFSDVFYLCGAAWELRIAAEAVPGPRPQDYSGNTSTNSTIASELQDHVSVYLHSVNHMHRVDFRVSLFGPNGWHVREAKGWTAEFAGKGWGIRPFCSRKTILRDFMHDGLIKMCVAPVGVLY
jgi:hypothetical protein